MLIYYLSLLETEEDKSKFTQLYEKYSKLMKYVAADILRDDHLAEDAVHNAFLNVIKSFYMVEDIDGHKTKRLLVVVTENAAIDMLRKTKHEANVSYDELEPILSVESDMLDNIAAQELADMLLTLPEIYRNVLELRAYHGLNDKQISAVLNVEHATVRKRLERARSMLAEKLRRQQEGVAYESV